MHRQATCTRAPKPAKRPRSRPPERGEEPFMRSSSPKERRASGLPVALLAIATVFAIVTVARAADQAAPSDTTRSVIFLKETLVTGSRYPRAYYESPQAL